SLIGSLLGVDGDQIVYRRVCGNYDRVCRDDTATRGFNSRLLATFYFVGVGLCVDSPALLVDGPGKPGKILQRMKLSLTGKTQRGASIERIPGNAFDLFDINQPNPVCRLQLVIKNFP